MSFLDEREEAIELGISYGHDGAAGAAIDGLVWARAQGTDPAREVVVELAVAAVPGSWSPELLDAMRGAYDAGPDPFVPLSVA